MREGKFTSQIEDRGKINIELTSAFMAAQALNRCPKKIVWNCSRKSRTPEDIRRLMK